MASTAGKASKGNNQEKKNDAKSNVQQQKTPPKDVKLGDGVGNTIKDEINKQAIEWAKVGLKWLFDFIEAKVKDLPESIKKLRNNPETEQAFAKMWADQLYEKNLIPAVYRGLSDDMLIHNFHQEGYLNGMYVGFILSVMAMIDSNVPEDSIVSVRDLVVPNLLGHLYENRDEFTSRFDDEKYRWVLPKIPSGKKQEDKKQ